MAKNCALIPIVIDKKGEQLDSKLFKDLLSFTSNRAKAIELYQISKNNDFMEVGKDRLVLDDLGEPTLKSFLKETTLNNYIPEQLILQTLNQQIGRFTKRDTIRLYIDNKENQQELFQKVLNFNKTNPFKGEYVATIKKIADNESNRVFLSPKIEKKNLMNALEADKMEYNQNLNNRLRDILASKGVSVGALDELERRRGIAGVTDFDLAKDAATGLIELIRLADGVKGETVLPEEFAHFAIEAMDNNPLLNRLLSTIGQLDLVREILGTEYDNYAALYENNNDKLIKEAAGKLLAQALLQNIPVQLKSISLLFNRFVLAVKDFFKKFNGDSIHTAILDADSLSSQLAKDILSGSLDNNIKLSNIHTTENFYNVSDRVQRDHDLLNKIRETELKRLSIYGKRNTKSVFTEHQLALIEKLEMELADNNYVEGIYGFLGNTLTELSKVSSRLTTLMSTPGTSLNDKASVLRDVRNYMYSYSDLLKEVKTSLREEELSTDNRYGAKVRETVNLVSELLDNLHIDYDKVTLPLFVEFIKPFLGEEMVVPFGKDKGKVVKADELVKMASKDISFIDRWLDSMADSSDDMLKIMDQAVKRAKGTSRLRTIELQQLIQAAAIKLEQSGIKNMEWMFEKNSKGELTGDYISDINYGHYAEKYKEFLDGLQQRYGKNPVGVEANKYRLERTAWLNSNRETIAGQSQPKRSIYINKVYNTLSTALKEYYDTIMDIKSKLDDLIPDKYTHPSNAILIRKDLIERAKGTKSIQGAGKELWENIKDQFLRRVDDTDFGDKATVIDFEKHEVQMLPIYYTRKLEDMHNLSTDITSTLVAYASMATDFDEMGNILDTLEIGRDLLRQRQIDATEGGKPLVERFKVMGRQVENKLFKNGDKTRFMERLDDFFEMQVYGRYMADEGTFGNSKIDKAKVANFVNRMTSMNSLALNLLSGISNITTGSIMMRTEALAGEFFKEKDVILADRNYGKELPAFLAQIGSRIQTNKLALWEQYFDTMLEYDKEIKHTDFDRKTWFSKMFSSSTLFFMNNAGEHWMQNRTSLALANNYKMKSPEGKLVNLWDAMEVIHLDNSNKDLGARLQLKQGYTKEDGSEFTKEDVEKFTRRSAALNQRMYGIYNKIDRSAVQRLALGRMAVMFRKYMIPSLNRRFAKAAYNQDLQAWTEGYYNTTGKFLVTLAKDLRLALFTLAAHWGELTKTEKSNIKRAIVETAHFALIALFLGLMDWGTDKDRPWAIRMAEYLARRLYTEIGALVPGPQMMGLMLTLLKSPAAGVKTIENTLSVLDIFNPVAWNTDLQSGRYKGHSKAFKSMLESPFVPTNKTIYRVIHPELGIPFFNQ